MFKPLEMNKVNIFIKNSDLKKVTDVLYDFKLMEFFTVDEEKFEKFEHEDLNVILGELLQLRSTIKILKGYFKSEGKSFVENPIELTNNAKTELDRLNKEIAFLEDESRREAILRSLKLKEKDFASYTVGFISSEHKALLEKFDSKKTSYTSVEHEGRIYFATKSKSINFSFKEFYLPKESIENISQKLKIAWNKYALAEEELVFIANNNLDHLEKKELRLTKRISALEAKTKFSKTTNICVLSGFVTRKQTSKLKHELEKILADKFEIDVEHVKEDAPIKLENGPISSNFEALLRMYSLPKYGEFDPTILMFLLFPIFFGFMLGDVGYGVLSFIIFTLAKFKLKNLKEFLTVLQLSSFISIIFGFIYGEYFGFESHYHLLNRIESPEQLLLIAVIFGAVHINLGVIIGFINQIHHLKHAICDKLSWIIMEIGVGIFSFGIYKHTTIATVIGALLFIIAVVLIYIGHGFMGIIEIPSFFTNIFSYARLMAVGVASVVVALLINEYTLIMFKHGALGIISGILLFTIGHVLNIVLGNFESFLHTLRLHYVEFFTKFYTGGGREFIPFGQRLRDED